jgi:hypothetical protein
LFTLHLGFSQKLCAKLTELELARRVEKVQEYCLNESRFDSERTIFEEFEYKYSESTVGRWLTQPSTEFLRNRRRVGNFSLGDRTHAQLVDILAETSERLSLKPSQRVCLAACAARIMVRYSVFYWSSLFALSSKVLEVGYGTCAEIVEVLVSLSKAIGIEIRESSVDPFYGILASEKRFGAFHASISPTMSSGLYHKLTKVRLEDGREYYFDPLLSYKKVDGYCSFYSAERSK